VNHREAEQPNMRCWLLWTSFTGVRDVRGRLPVPSPVSYLHLSLGTAE